jgi:hypothetical protein
MPRDGIRAVPVRALIALASLLLAGGPVMWLAFGRSARAATPAPAARAAAASATPAAGCKETKLAYGLTNDREGGRAYESQILFGAHPPLPAPGFYAPADSPDPDALLHALSHGWMIVKYRPGGDLGAFKRLGRELSSRRVVVVSGGQGMPFALGAVVWGAQETCAKAADAAAGARAFALRHSNPL